MRVQPDPALARPRRASGFTLLELLIAIGIIVVLVSILVPVVTNLRKSAYEADTRQQIAALVSAIELYHGDHGAYPGPFANDLFTNDAPGRLYHDDRQEPTDVAAVNPFPNPLDITAAEGLVLGLLGGLRYDSSLDGYVYEWWKVGEGPSSLNPDAPKRHAAYAEPLNLSWNMAGRTPSRSAGRFTADGATANDTVIPEYVDRFPTPLPILYLRANVGTDAVISDESLGVLGQYDLEQIIGYTSADIGDYGKFPGGHGLKDLGSDADPLLPGEPNKFQPYLRHPSLGGARNKNGFILISAGRDRVYGTDDDITNFGSVIP